MTDPERPRVLARTVGRLEYRTRTVGETAQRAGPILSGDAAVAGRCPAPTAEIRARVGSAEVRV